MIHAKQCWAPREMHALPQVPNFCRKMVKLWVHPIRSPDAMVALNDTNHSARMQVQGRFWSTARV